MDWAKYIATGTVNAITGLATASSAFPFQEIRKIACHLDRDSPALIWDVAESQRVTLGSNSSSATQHPNNVQSFMPQSHAVFSRTLSKGSFNEIELELIKNGVKRWKMIRHPKCLNYSEGHQTELAFNIATDFVVPVNIDYCKSLDEASICWGLYQIASALQFLHKDCQLLHGNVRLGGGVFADKSGQWKLGGFELTCSLKDSFIFQKGKSFFHSANEYFPPELADNSWTSLASPDPIDSWYFGILIYEVFNGTRWSNSSSHNPGKIPKILHSSYKSLLHPNPNTRLMVSAFLEAQKMPNGYFNNHFLKHVEFLDSYSVQNPVDKETFFSWIASHGLESYPTPFRLYKLIPIIAHAIEFGIVSGNLVPLILEASSEYSPDEYERLFQNILVKLIQHQDRGIRIIVMEKASVMKAKLDSKTLNEKVFPALLSGFTDPHPALREATLRTCIFLSDKLSETSINQELIKYLGRLQGDEQPGIRTNTIIAIGKLTKNLTESIRGKVLIPALMRAMQDPFTPCRTSALLAFKATFDFIDPVDLCSKILPCVCPLLLDADSNVRNQALSSIKACMNKMESHLEKMNIEDSSKASKSSTIESKSDDFWSVSALTKKLINTDVFSSSSSGKGEAPKSAPVAEALPVAVKSTESKSSSIFPSAASDAMMDINRIKSDSSKSMNLSSVKSSGGKNDWGQLDIEIEQEDKKAAVFKKSNVQGNSSKAKGWDEWDDEWEPM